MCRRMRQFFADMNHKAELLKKRHGFLMRSHAAAVNKVFRTTVQGGVVDG